MPRLLPELQRAIRNNKSKIRRAGRRGGAQEMARLSPDVPKNVTNLTKQEQRNLAARLKRFNSKRMFVMEQGGIVSQAEIAAYNKQVAIRNKRVAAENKMIPETMVKQDMIAKVRANSPNIAAKTIRKTTKTLKKVNNPKYQLAKLKKEKKLLMRAADRIESASGMKKGELVKAVRELTPDKQRVLYATTDFYRLLFSYASEMSSEEDQAEYYDDIAETIAFMIKQAR